MLSLKNVTFKTKVQTSFFVIAVISTVMVVNDLYNFFQLSRINETLNQKIIVSRENLTDVQTEFQSLQFYLLKFSIPGFENEFDKNFEAVDKHKSKIIEVMASIKDSSLADIFQERSQKFDKIFNEYFGTVVDGTLSAAAMKDFEMASYIATTSGEELRKKFEAEMTDIMLDINNRKEGLELSLIHISEPTRPY